MIGLLNSVVGAYYYLRVIVYMYMRPAEGTEAESLSTLGMAVALGVAVAVVFVLGVAADPVVKLAQRAGALL